VRNCTFLAAGLPRKTRRMTSNYGSAATRPSHVTVIRGGRKRRQRRRARSRNSAGSSRPARGRALSREPGFREHREPSGVNPAANLISPSGYVTVSTLSLFLPTKNSIDARSSITYRLILSGFVNLVKLVKSGSANVATRFTDARAIRDSVDFTRSSEIPTATSRVETSPYLARLSLIYLAPWLRDLDEDEARARARAERLSHISRRRFGASALRRFGASALRGSSAAKNLGPLGTPAGFQHPAFRSRAIIQRDLPTDRRL